MMITRAFALVLFVALATSIQIDRVSHSQDGRIRMMFGRLGSVSELSPVAALNFLKTAEARAALKLRGDEQFVHRDETSFKNHITTFRFDQFYHGLPVYGGEISIHIIPSTLEVYGVSANVLSHAPRPEAALRLDNKLMGILENAGHKKFKPMEQVSLLYVIDENDVSRLAYKFPVMSGKAAAAIDIKLGRESKMLEPFDIYIDAISHELIFDIPRHPKALFRQVFNAGNTEDLPGFLERSEGQGPTSDIAGNEAYDNAGYCYYFYLNVFDRDSWNNMGAPLNSSVHYSVDYDNAFWNGNQMVYGDGDNVIFSNFTNDLSVICHELSHAVTQSTSNLRYWYESGALNEGFSDIMGSSSVVYTKDPEFDTPDPATSWIIGPNCTLINLNPTGCPDCPLGLRYMDNPPLDGSSRDYYPDRYTGFQDERGVHTNSGIANLAYVLTVQGGVQPQDKTDIYVDAIGIAAAQNIYYVANTQFATSTTHFSDFRLCCEEAAQLLYSNSTAINDSVSNAWAAVGVDEPQ